MTLAELYLEDLKTKYKKINLKEYYLSYSGGRDSHLLYWFQKEYAPEYSQIPVISANTYMEHPEILERMFKYSDKMLIPQLKPQEIKDKFGIPCFTKHQDYLIYEYQNGNRSDYIMDKVFNKTYTHSGYNLSKYARELLLSGELHRVSNKCCEYLKKLPFKEYEKQTGRKAILGVKAEESILRKTKYKSCMGKNKKFTPLFDLTNKLEDEIYTQYNIPIPDIYSKVKRTGCMGCPYGRDDVCTELILMSKVRRDFVLNLFGESYEVIGIDTDNYK